MVTTTRLGPGGYPVGVITLNITGTVSSEQVQTSDATGETIINRSGRFTHLGLGGYPVAIATPPLYAVVTSGQVQTTDAEGTVKTKTKKVGVGGARSGNLKDYSVHYITGTVVSSNGQQSEGEGFQVKKPKPKPKKKDKVEPKAAEPEIVRITGKVDSRSGRYKSSAVIDCHIGGIVSSGSRAGYVSVISGLTSELSGYSCQVQCTEAQGFADQWPEDDLLAIMGLLNAA